MRCGLTEAPLAGQVPSAAFQHFPGVPTLVWALGKFLQVEPCKPTELVALLMQVSNRPFATEMQQGMSQLPCHVIKDVCYVMLCLSYCLKRFCHPRVKELKQVLHHPLWTWHNMPQGCANTISCRVHTLGRAVRCLLPTVYVIPRGFEWSRGDFLGRFSPGRGGFNIRSL